MCIRVFKGNLYEAAFNAFLPSTNELIFNSKTIVPGFTGFTQ